MAEYTDLATVKAALGITDSTRDALVAAAIRAASRAIEDQTGRRFDLDGTASTRTYNPWGRVVCDGRGEVLLVDDIGSLDDLAVEVGYAMGWSAVSDYETWPDTALADGRPILALVQPLGTWRSTPRTRVRVTARWGWPEVPDPIAQAAQLQAARLYRRKDSPEGVAGSAEWGMTRIPRLDPDVAALVGPYELPGIG